jgi:hypothetical protein
LLVSGALGLNEILFRWKYYQDERCLRSAVFQQIDPVLMASFLHRSDSSWYPMQEPFIIFWSRSVAGCLISLLVQLEPGCQDQDVYEVATPNIRFENPMV